MLTAISSFIKHYKILVLHEPTEYICSAILLIGVCLLWYFLMLSSQNSARHKLKPYVFAIYTLLAVHDIMCFLNWTVSI